MRLGEKFRELRERGEKALITYYTGGFPTLAESMDNLLLCQNSGADIVEVGIPFSDPVADGPVIQHTSHTALANGANPVDIIKAVGETDFSIPLVVMTYLNPVLAVGYEHFVRLCSDSGVSGLIIPDISFEDADIVQQLCGEAGIDLIYMVAPNTPAERMKKIAFRSSGFIYCVASYGTTGAKKELSSSFRDIHKRLSCLTDTPIAAGFGVSSTGHVRTVSECCDGVIIGSRILTAFINTENAAPLIEEFKKSTRIMERNAT